VAAPGERSPTVVLMLGEPGSGKTELGTRLARTLGVPFLARDDVRTGLYFTTGAWTDDPGPPPPRDEATATFLTLVEALAGLGVSCVVEYVIRDDRPEDLERITRVAHCVGVRTGCDDAPSRQATRERADPLLRRPPVLAALGYEGIDEHVAQSSAHMAAVTSQMRTSFDFPVLAVGTDDGYDPSLPEIVEFIARRGGGQPSR
jgi:predicted kinase